MYIRAVNLAGMGPESQPYFFDSADEGMLCLIPSSPFWSPFQSYMVCLCKVWAPHMTLCCRCVGSVPLYIHPYCIYIYFSAYPVQVYPQEGDVCAYVILNDIPQI